MVVHLGMLFFIPLIAVVIYMILRGVEGTAARVGRWALVPFVVFYGAFETLIGLGNGILVHEVNGMVGAEKAGGAALIAEFNDNVLIKGFGIFPSIGSLGFIAAVIATGIALHRHAGAPLAVPILLGLSGFLITAHPPPFGPTGLALFIVAVLLFVRSQATGAHARRWSSRAPPSRWSWTTPRMCVSTGQRRRACSRNASAAGRPGSASQASGARRGRSDSIGATLARS